MTPNLSAVQPLPGVEAYDFTAPGRIAFGWGRRNELGKLAAGLGQRAFIVAGSRTLVNQGAIDEFKADLTRCGVEPIFLAATSVEPSVSQVDSAAGGMRSYHCAAGDIVIALGGGSAIDLAKAAAALAPNRAEASVADYLEGVGRGLTLTEPPLPVIAVPTTAGTGSEATKNAVISSSQPAYKKSLRADAMIPRIALVDPELTVSVPPKITAETGLDAITQLIESYLSGRAKPMAQSLALDGLRRAFPAITAAFHDGQNRPAREAMSYAALLSGLALANSGLGLAHGVAAALGVTANVAHGLACAIMLPVALKVNRKVCAERYAALACCLPGPVPTGTESAADWFVDQVAALVNELGVPRKLSALGVAAAQIPELVRGSRGNSMSGNPRAVSDPELTDLLEEML